MNPVGGGGYWGRGGGWGRRNWYRATGLTGWQRAAAGMPAYGGRWGYPPAYGAPAGYPPAPTREQEREALQSQVEYLEETLKDLQSRLEELETEEGGAEE